MNSSLAIQPAIQPVAFRDVASVLFRHKRLFGIFFWGVTLITVCVALLFPHRYESSAKVLVEHQNLDNTLSPRGANSFQGPPAPVTEAELDSELELMQTDDILRNVVTQTALAGNTPSSQLIDKTAARLKKHLHIAPIGESNVISVAYRSTDPQQAAKVVNTLLALYLQKHVQISGSAKEYDFFNSQVMLYKKQLAQLEDELAKASVVSPALARDQMVYKQSDLKAEAATTRAQISAIEQRLTSLRKLEQHTPRSVVTEQKTQDNPQLMQDLKGTLLSLELQRDQLLSKYQPTYRPVLELNTKIADAEAAIARQKSEPLLEKTTAQNNAYDWIRTDLAKSEAELQGLLGRQQADESIIASGDNSLHALNNSAIAQEDLARQAKTAEANYLFYLQKREEVRVSAALDARNLFNIVVVQRADVPTIPLHQRLTILVVGFCLAVLLSLAAVLISDMFDPRFRSVHELAASLDVPVLAAISTKYDLTAGMSAAPQHNTLHESGSV